MVSLFKIWAAANVEGSWTSDLENFITSKAPTTQFDVEKAIKEYQTKNMQ